MYWNFCTVCKWFFLCAHAWDSSVHSIWYIIGHTLGHVFFNACVHQTNVALVQFIVRIRTMDSAVTCCWLEHVFWEYFVLEKIFFPFLLPVMCYIPAFVYVFVSFGSNLSLLFPSMQCTPSSCKTVAFDWMAWIMLMWLMTIHQVGWLQSLKENK